MEARVRALLTAMKHREQELKEELQGLPDGASKSYVLGQISMVSRFIGELLDVLTHSE